MSDRKCPYCGSQSFYVKDPDDQHEIYEFDLQGGAIQFKPKRKRLSGPSKSALRPKLIVAHAPAMANSTL